MVTDASRSDHDAHLAGFDAERPRTGHLADCWLDVEHLEYALRRGEAFLQIGVQDRERLDRLVGEQQRGDEREKGAGVRAPLITCAPP